MKNKRILARRLADVLDDKCSCQDYSYYDLILNILVKLEEEGDEVKE